MAKLLLSLILTLFLASCGGGGGGGGSTGGSGGSGGSGSSAGDGNLSSSNYNSDLSKIVIQVRNENFSEALTDLEKYVYENPNDSNGWNYIGFVSRKLKKFDDAERYYSVGLEISPNHVGILEYQGELYIETNRLEMAKQNLKKLNDLCIFNCNERNELRDLIVSAND